MILPKKNNVARYCKPSTLDNSGVNFNAFQLNKQNGENYLSVYWLEYFKNKNISDNLKEVYNFQKNVIGYGLSHNGAYAILNVKETIDSINKLCRVNLMIRQIIEDEPVSCHSGIFNTSSQELIISEKLSELANSNKIFRISEHFHDSKNTKKKTVSS